MAKSDAKGQKHLESVKARGYENLECTPAEMAAKTPEELMNVLMKEGLKLLETEKKKDKVIPPSAPPKSDPKVLESALGAMSKNPYVRARIKILNDLPEDRRKKLEDMEKNGNTNNHVYEHFVKMVVKLGDQFST